MLTYILFDLYFVFINFLLFKFNLYPLQLGVYLRQSAAATADDDKDDPISLLESGNETTRLTLTPLLFITISMTNEH